MIGAAIVLGAWMSRIFLLPSARAWVPRQARVTLLGLVLAVAGAGASATGGSDPILWSIPIVILGSLAVMRPEPARWGAVAWLAVVPAVWIVRPPAGTLVQDVSWLVFASLHATLGLAWLGALVIGAVAADRRAFGRAFATNAPFLVGGAALAGLFTLVRANPFDSPGGTIAFAVKAGAGAVALLLALVNARLAKRGRMPWPPLALEVVTVLVVVATSSALVVARIG